MLVKCLNGKCQLNFRDRLDILLEKKLSCVAEEGYKMLYGKSWFRY